MPHSPRLGVNEVTKNITPDEMRAMCDRITNATNQFISRKLIKEVIRINGDENIFLHDHIQIISAISVLITANLLDQIKQIHDAHSAKSMNFKKFVDNHIYALIETLGCDHSPEAVH